MPSKVYKDGDAQVTVMPSGLLSPSALRKPDNPASIVPPYVDLTIEAANDDGVEIDPKSGAVTITGDDGSIDIDFNPQATAAIDRESEFGDNLAEIIDAMELGTIASDLVQRIGEDDQSRNEWLTTRANGLRTLGLKIEDPRAAIDATAALEGMSSVRHPMLLEAVLNFWANATGELLPAGGPVKVEDKMDTTAESQELAEQFEGDFNYYLTTIATEYYPDTSRALFNVGFGGCVFKKVYRCPLRERPVSESIDAVNLIVSNAITDIKNSARVTHVVTMRPSVLKRMQLAGAYRNVPITAPVGVVPNPVDETIGEIQGVQLNTMQMDDREHTIYECYCELDIPGFEDKRDGKTTGLPLPYRVVLDKDSQQILEIRRNWREDDDTKTAKSPFIVYMFVPGLGFYGIGLLHILGNTTNALTAAWRETLDSGMFANFPGFLYSKLMGRQNTNEFRVPPGGGAPIETNGMKIQDAVMPLPYKDVSQAFVEFQKHIEELGSRLGGAAQVKVAEGRQDAPVGTTLAMLEQATKVESAVHKELWRAQSEEFQLMKALFREHPQDFIDAMKQKGSTDWDEGKFLQALDEASIVPQADPNTPSHMHRLMKAMGLIQLDKAYPGEMSPTKIVKRVVAMLGFGDFDSLKNDQQQGGMPPEAMAKMAELQLGEKKLADAAEARASKAMLAEKKIQGIQLEGELEGRQQAHETAMQDQESTDQVAEREAQVRVAELGVTEAQIESAGDMAVEELREKTEDTKGGHAVAAAKAKPKPKSPK